MTVAAHRLTRIHLFASLFMLTAAMSLGACGMNPIGTHAPKFKAMLSGAQEVPANASPGSGTLEATLNRDTNLLRWTVNYSGLTGSVKAGHFHGPAMAGQNAGVALPFSGNLSSPIEGQATLTPEQVAELMAGKWYVNLHTAAYPGGEVRGQAVMGK